MSNEARQLVLNFKHEPRFGEEDFLVSFSNETAWNMIHSWENWNNPVLILTGPEGSGKSHLAAIWAHKTKAQFLDAKALTEQTLHRFLEYPALVIEDLDRNLHDEAVFFHFLNRIYEHNIYLLITAQTPPSLWSVKTHDLLSRFRLAPTVDLAMPDDQLLRAVLVKLFYDRQLIVDKGVVDYLILRVERSLAKMQEVVYLLDQEALRRGRRLTRAMASEFFKDREE